MESGALHTKEVTCREGDVDEPDESGHDHEADGAHCEPRIVLPLQVALEVAPGCFDQLLRAVCLAVKPIRVPLVDFIYLCESI